MIEYHWAITAALFAAVVGLALGFVWGYERRSRLRG